MKTPSTLLALLLLAACQSPTTTERDTSYLEEITIRQLQQAYQDGTFSIEQVVSDYLYRIETLDDSGPNLNSILALNPNAVQEAKQLDAELKSGKLRGPLHGIPVILKDNINTHDMPTTAGATVLQHSYPPADSYLTKKLREAGAIVLGKANLSEWANFRANFSSSGWSGAGGQTKNPYVLDRNPCGSSSGSAVAVAANLCTFAIGTETNGSIVCPSNNNGIVGLKPTVGLLSRSGIIPISFTQDTPGPMARTVEDVAVSLSAMTGVDSSDAKSVEAAGGMLSNYTEYLKADGLKGKRIGLMRNAMGYHHGVDVLFRQVAQDLQKGGAEVVELDFILDRSVRSSSFTVLLYEFNDGLKNYFASLGEDALVHNLNELIAYNKGDSIELKYFDQHTLELAAEKNDLSSKEYTDALSHMLLSSREQGIDKILSDHNLDALMAPTGSPAWKTDLVDGDHFMGGSSSYAAMAGYPSITVPMGLIEDLPVGVSFFSRAFAEPTLIEIAYAYEQATRHRQAPTYIPSK